MKKFKVAVTLLLLAAAPALAAKDKDKGESVVLPDVEMIAVPTAGILDYYGFMVKTRAYSGGGVLTGLNFGVLERLNLGASMTVPPASTTPGLPTPMPRTGRGAESTSSRTRSCTTSIASTVRAAVSLALSTSTAR